MVSDLWLLKNPFIVPRDKLAEDWFLFFTIAERSQVGEGIRHTVTGFFVWIHSQDVTFSLKQLWRGHFNHLKSSFLSKLYSQRFCIQYVCPYFYRFYYIPYWRFRHLALLWSRFRRYLSSPLERNPLSKWAKVCPCHQNLVQFRK